MLLDTEVIRFGSFVLKSGQVSPVYFDFRRMISYPEVFNQIGLLVTQYLISNLNESDLENNIRLVGVPDGATPLATVVSQISGLPLLMGRKMVKTHGGKKLVEGVFNPGDRVIVLEDVTTTGNSMVEFADRLVGLGLEPFLVCLLDRRMDRSRYPHIRSLLNLDDLLHDDRIDNSMLAPIITVPHLTTRQFNHPIGDRLTELMLRKKSNICLSNDVTDAKEFIKILLRVAPYVVMVKTHLDTVSNPGPVVDAIRITQEKHGFIWMEDRKFADIGSTVVKQYQKYRYKPDLVTSHGIAGVDSVKALVDQGVGVVLIKDMSSTGQLCSDQYQDRLVHQYGSMKGVVGMVCQKGIRRSNLFQFTPGVRIGQTSDGMGQQWRSPKSKLIQGADILIVGRGIYQAEDPVAAVKMYRQQGWDEYTKLMEPAQSPTEPIWTGVDTRVDLFGGRVNCFYNAAGIFGMEHAELNRLSKSGVTGVVLSKTATIDPLVGHPEPTRYLDPDSDLSINAVGLRNYGLPYYLGYDNPANKKYVVSVSMDSFTDPRCIKMIRESNVTGIEVNGSCPTYHQLDGLQTDPALVQLGVDLSQDRGGKVWGLKLSPTTPVKTVERMVEMCNWDYVVCCNSIPNGVVVSEQGNPVISHGDGGVAGTGANKALSLGMIRWLHTRYPNLTIIGAGGVKTAQDIVDYLQTGAKAVQVGTALWREGVELFEKLQTDLQKLLARLGYDSVTNLIESSTTGTENNQPLSC